ncbi:translation initiation factor IF-1 [Candidatus Parcubacteria bacterium]|nr:translation initiation factor IF-1 [Candidatus Parcubacteria bacterium]
MNSSNKQEEQVEGVVTEALPEAMFKVLIDGAEEEVLAYLAGKMRMYRIRVLVGDRVLLKTDPYGGKAIIYKRI